jgi:L-lactate dehydrogenase
MEKAMKISLIGTGRVGSTLAFQLLMRGLGNQLVLVDRNREVAEGEALDLQHAEAFTSHSMKIRAGDIGDTAGSDLLVLTCSVPWKPQYTSRFQIGRDNLTIYRDLVPELVAKSPDARIVVVSNPVDVMTYHTLKLSGFGPERVFGTGTLVDSGRFRSMLSAKLGIHPDDVRAYILGEHGDSQFPFFSNAVAGGARIAEDDATIDLFHKASHAGHDVMRRKGHTNFAITMAAALVIEAIARDSRRTTPLSVLIDGYLGVADVCLSLPVVVGRPGITQVLYPDMSEPEITAFRRCADMVRQGISESLG